jgi:hypothetical protein
MANPRMDAGRTTFSLFRLPLKTVRLRPPGEMDGSVGKARRAGCLECAQRPASSVEGVPNLDLPRSFAGPTFFGFDGLLLNRITLGFGPLIGNILRRVGHSTGRTTGRSRIGGNVKQIASLYCAMCLLGACAMAEAAPRIAYKGLPGTGIEIVPPTSQEFMDALQRSADPQALLAIQPILPYSVMVKNGSSEWLFTVTIRIQVVNAAGKATMHTVTQGTRDNSHASMIAPGSMIFMTPIGGLNTVLPRQGTMHIVNDEHLAARIATRVPQYSQGSYIETALDSVVFEDGGLVGPDGDHIMALLNSWAEAEGSIIKEVLARHGDDIKNYLESARDDTMNSVDLDKLGSTFTSGDHYFVERRKSFADELLWQRDVLSTEEEFFKFLRHKAETTVRNVWRRD